MVTTTHDWTTPLLAMYVAKESASKRENNSAVFFPTSYRRPDGTEATFCGTVYATLRIDGAHMRTNAEYKVRGHNRASGETCDGIFNAPTKHVGEWTVSALRAALPEPAVLIVEVPCDECHGRGKVECFACGHEDTCDDCGGTGKHTGEKDDLETYLRINGSRWDAKYLAPVLAIVPDESVRLEIGTGGKGKDEGKVALLRIVGTDWQILAAAKDGDLDEAATVTDYPQVTHATN